MMYNAYENPGLHVVTALSVLIATTEKVQDKEIRTGEGRGWARRRGLRQGVVFTLVCCTNAHLPTLLFPIFVAFCGGSISPFHLETMDLPFPQCLISDPWRDGHLDISLLLCYDYRVVSMRL